MTRSIRKGAEEARAQLPALLLAAERGRQTIITRHGRPVAVLAPMSAGGERPAQRSILSLAGSGRGLYGRDSRAALRKLRDEWGR
jgi:prevent-host-death family protein